MVFGEITTKAKVDYEAVVRKTCKEIGFTAEDVGLNADTCKVMVHIEEQSPDIGQGVHGMGTKTLEEIGAGDQGHMFGYATDEVRRGFGRRERVFFLVGRRRRGRPFLPVCSLCSRETDVGQPTIAGALPAAKKAMSVQQQKQKQPRRTQQNSPTCPSAKKKMPRQPDNNRPPSSCR